MLQTLKEKPPGEAENLLSCLVFNKSPHIDDTLCRANETQNQLLKDIESEIRRKLRIGYEDNTYESDGKIFQFIYQELDNFILPAKQEESVKDRIGQKGLLKNHLYKIDFINLFDKIYLPLGIRKNQVSSTIRRPDSYQHIFPKQFGLEIADSISLFFKLVNKNLCMLVLTVRDGSTLKVCHAWQLHPPEINNNIKHNPIEILKFFINKYGVDFTVRSKTTNFLYYEKMPLRSKGELQRILDSYILKSTYIVNIYVQENKKLDCLEIALVFIIDLQKYSNALKIFKK